MTRTICLLSTLATLTAACGGGGPSRPKPLSTHFDESYLDTVPYAKKEVVFRAQNQYQRARAKYREAQAKLDESRTMLQVAKNERQQAMLDEKSASEKSKQAESTGDMNRVNAAAKESRVAELARRAADEKVEARQSEVKYLEKLVLYAEEEMYHQEARFELTKAKLARDNHIQPKGFKYNSYQEQVDKRSKRAQRAKLVADQELQKANEHKKKWEAARKQVDAARGVPSPGSTGAVGGGPPVGSDSGTGTTGSGTGTDAGTGTGTGTGTTGGN